MRRITFRLLLALGLLGTLLPATSAAARTSLLDEVAETVAASSSTNMAHVVNLPHKRRTSSGSLTKAATQGGTDIEFTTLQVPRTDENGLPVLDELGQQIVDTRDFALAGTYSNGLQIVDITNPEAPVTTGVYDCAISQGDVQVFTREVEGVTRTYVTYTSDNGYSVGAQSTCVKEAKALNLPGVGKYVTGFGSYIADITDPANPVTVSYYENPTGSHNQTVAPGGMYLYNSNADIGPLDRTDPADQTGRIEVIDISDLSAPREVTRIPLQTGADSHDITFSEDGKRAYTAALTHTLVLDTTDLAAPKVIGRILDPAVNIHHQADPVTLTDKTTGMERTFLVVSDELAGAAGNGVCPGGGLHIYDMTGQLEAAPVKVGFWAIPDTRPVSGTGSLTCTSHVLRLHPKEAIMTIAWYDAGVHVVDISGLVGVSLGAGPTGNVGAGMVEKGFFAFDNSDTWSAKTNRIEPDGSFFLYGNDQARGFDVYRYSATAPAAAEPGTWLNPAQALAAAQTREASTDLRPFCLLRNRV